MYGRGADGRDGMVLTIDMTGNVSVSPDSMHDTLSTYSPSSSRAASVDLEARLCPHGDDIVLFPAGGFRFTSEDVLWNPLSSRSTLFSTLKEDVAGGFSIVSRTLPEDFLRKGALGSLIGM